MPWIVVDTGGRSCIKPETEPGSGKAKPGSASVKCYKGKGAHARAQSQCTAMNIQYARDHGHKIPPKGK